jgi:DNA invertase Pin-like site-specific DNA recombinase
MTRAAIWARVSTEDQHTENQLQVLRKRAHDCGLEVVTEFVTEDSAWAGAKGGNGKGAEFEARRSAMLAGVRRGEYSVIFVWAIDRLSRQGSEDMQRYLRLLAEAGADVRSDQESWLNTADPFAREILIGVFATLAKYESQRRSERTKAGLARRKAEGKPVGGRKAGAKDRKPRQRDGYTAAWAEGGARRSASSRASIDEP